MKKIFDLCNPAVPVDWSICIDQEVHKQWIDWKEIWLWVFHRKMMFAHSDWVVATTQNNKALFLTLQDYSNGIWEDGKYWIYRGYYLMPLYSLWFFLPLHYISDVDYIDTGVFPTRLRIMIVLDVWSSSTSVLAR